MNGLLREISSLCATGDDLCLIAGYFLKFMPYVKFNKIVFSERNDYNLPKIMASKHFWLTIQ